MFHDAYPKFGSKGRSSRLFSHISSNLIWTLPFQQRRQKVWGTVWEEAVLVIGHALPQAISWALVASNYWNSALCYQSPGRTPGQNSWAELLGRTPGQNSWAELLGRPPGQTS
ncbi:unnamed protein product [Cyberlindnera jadinii]|uniref:Uncharacterized protein n=1 Tax=Cyberlindnera jadinii (strain ATCC 18201 / CBS 1600 / BCRC 20928 / JCM 3617 / NBRC 0987 / NRRL Y-1542) TaxID=983966 RepID=A0A0H5C153_CYBJN|nr:unnamed protein product [Cyberlindnera jadinii]